MARLPSWLIPGGLAALTLGLVWSTRQKNPAAAAAAAVGDTVSVPAKAIGVPLPPNGLIPANAEIAVVVNAIDGEQVRGNGVGFIDPATKALRLVAAGLPVGFGNVGFTRGAITGIWRGNPLVKVA